MSSLEASMCLVSVMFTPSVPDIHPCKFLNGRRHTICQSVQKRMTHTQKNRTLITCPRASLPKIQKVCLFGLLCDRFGIKSSASLKQCHNMLNFLGLFPSLFFATGHQPLLKMLQSLPSSELLHRQLFWPRTASV